MENEIFRPKDGHELLEFLKLKRKCEVVNSHAFLAADAISGKIIFTFKLSKWNTGWAGFEKI